MRVVSSVSGVIARSVFTVTLTERPDPREQIRRATELLRPGNVRVNVRSVRAIPFGFPIPNHLDETWMRPDLDFQFESSDDDSIAQEWRDLANFLNSRRGGSKW